MSTRRVASATSVLPQALKKFAFAAEGAGTKAEHGDLEARTAELSVFHLFLVILP